MFVEADVCGRRDCEGKNWYYMLSVLRRLRIEPYHVAEYSYSVIVAIFVESSRLPGN